MLYCKYPIRWTQVGQNCWEFDLLHSERFCLIFRRFMAASTLTCVYPCGRERRGEYAPLRLSSRLATINLIRFKWVGWPIRHLEFETVTYQRHNNLHRALNCRLIRPEVKNNSRQDVHCSPAHRKSEQDSFSSSESVSKLAEKSISSLHKALNIKF